MIKLEIKGYCQNCCEFEVELAEFINEKNRKVFLISCKNQSKCEAIEYYLSQRAAGDMEMKINALTETQREDCRRTAESLQRIR